MSSMYIVKGIHGYCHFSIKMTILVTKYYKEQKTVLLVINSTDIVFMTLGVNGF